MDNRKNIILIIIVAFLATSIFFLVNTNRQEDEAISMNDRGGDSFSRWFNIKYRGDISAYDDAKIEALDDNYRDEAFYNYALIMADKYNYIPAYFDVYWALYSKQELYNDTLYTLDSLNESDRKIAYQTDFGISNSFFTAILNNTSSTC